MRARTGLKGTRQKKTSFFFLAENKCVWESRIDIRGDREGMSNSERCGLNRSVKTYWD